MRYSGRLGIVEEQEVRPGVWEEVVTEQKVLGTMENTVAEARVIDGEIIPRITSTRSVSVPARGVGQRDNRSIRYATWAGRRWTITSVVDQYPNIVCYFGEVYSGPLPAGAPDGPGGD